MAQAGVRDLESNTLTGIVAPAGTPKDIIERWHREIVRIVALPEVNANLRTLGFDPIATSPEEYAGRIKAEAEKWSKVAHDAKIRID
jgi:tripartite-type tricarboxylate transporter receptor subunit TctC